MLKVSLDGGKTWQVTYEGVRIVTEDMNMPGEDANGDLHFNFTDEGMILDVWSSEDDRDRNLATKSQTYDEIMAELFDDGILS